MRVLIFGTFDGIHDGHRYFFASVRKRIKSNDQLVACVTRDEIVQELKNHLPHKKLNTRIFHVKKNVDKGIPGDKVLGSWEVITRVKPGKIFLGYDQLDMMKPLLQLKNTGVDFDIEVVVRPYKPDIFKSSIIKTNEKINKIESRFPYYPKKTKSKIEEDTGLD